MKKTLGGDRLGSGNKMQVELHGYERSTHDLGYLWRSTMAAGTLVPFLTEVALPGDTFDIDLNCDIKTHPTIGPLFGSYKVQLDVFCAPIRLYQGQLHNNKLGIGLNMNQVRLPQIELLASVFNATFVNDLDNAQINPSSILAYLGIRGVGQNEPTFANEPRQFNALTLLAYWDIYKNYYANKQEEIGAVIHTPQQAIVNTVSGVIVYQTSTGPAKTIPLQGVVGPTGPIQIGGYLEIPYVTTPPLPEQIMLNTTDGERMSVQDFMFGEPIDDPGVKLTVYYDASKHGTVTILESWQMIQPNEMPQIPPEVATFPLENIDLMREAILQDTANTQPFIVNDANLTPYSYILGATGGFNHMLSSQEGLALKTYQSDLFNNWLQTEWIDGPSGITALTAIDTSGGQFTIDTLNLAKKVYDMLNRIAVSGGTYDDWLDAVWTHDRFTRVESPMYLGGLSKELVFQEVVSNASTGGQESNANQPLGTLAGKGIMSNKHKGGHIIAKVDEPSYIIGIISLTPRVDYSQGNKWDVHLQSMDDLHKPALDQIGFQELITEQMAWWDTTRDNTTGAWVTRSAGKQPAYINYMTNVNITRGNFAIPSNEMFMTLNRRYEPLELSSTGIKDLTTYIDPAKFNNIFAQTARDSQNFWAQISVDMIVRRKMSAKVMPNL